MALFCVKTQTDDKATKFFKESDKRLQEGGRLGVTHEGSISGFNGPNPLLMVHYSIIDMRPIYPPFYLGGLVMIVAGVVFNKISIWLYVPGVSIFALGLLWCWPLMYLGLRLGLRKAGYRGEIKLVSKSKCLRAVMMNLKL